MQVNCSGELRLGYRNERLTKNFIANSKWLFSHNRSHLATINQSQSVLTAAMSVDAMLAQEGSVAVNVFR
jgi:hypothetical protein